MNRTTRFLALPTLLFAVAAPAARAQTAVTIGTGFGATMPIGDAADQVNVGWHAQLNLGFTNPDWPVDFRIDGMYHSLGGDDLDAGIELPGFDVIAGTANVQLFVSRNPGGGGLYLIGGGGIYNIDVDENDEELFDYESVTKAGFLGGAGYKFVMTNLLLSVQATYHHILTEGSATQLIPITLAAEIPFGGN